MSLGVCAGYGSSSGVPGADLAMTLDGQGRPVMAWTDDNGLRYGSEWALKVTTVLNARILTGPRPEPPAR
ncbi:hypothetical protein AB0K16_58405 [Nonomuraea jabiensis]|uniref:hypothetical protein n=1 Tax=Nonomuraea jabiensis TaxID=882448 RepID=UPI00341D6A9B